MIPRLEGLDAPKKKIVSCTASEGLKNRRAEGWNAKGAESK